jgi:dihydroorotate dehydrogenase electron transfer subunit
MRLEVPQSFASAKPGQFVHIRCTDGTDPLLRRPLSVHRIETKKGVGQATIQLLYKVVGKGTELLSRKRAGEGLDVLGPLGNGFRIRSSIKCHLIVAGGMGVAPLVGLADAIRRMRRPGRIDVIIGAKSEELVLCKKEFEKSGATVHVATEDGSLGFKGLASELLGDVLRNNEKESTAIYTCGPKPMLSAIGQISMEHGIPCQICMEESMACGIGFCMGCVVKV